MGSDSPRWLDPLLAVVLTTAGIALTLDAANGNGTALDSLVIPAVTLPVLWRRTAPLAAAVAVSVGIVVSGIPTFDQTRCGVAIPTALLILYSLASRRDRGPAVVGLGLVLAALVFLLFTDPQLDAGAAFIVPLAAGVWSAGRVVRSRNAVAVELAERSKHVEATLEQNARMAVEVERTRLASDLELVARGRLGEVVELADDPGRSTASFAAIEREGRASLNEMRGLLGSLRSDAPNVAPVPNLEQLEALVDEAGEAVTLTIKGDRRPLPGAVELAAYRLVQHALEGLGSEAVVTLRYVDGALEVEVDGAIGDRGALDAALAAARERVTVQGGTFTAEILRSARMLVSARLPVAAN